MDAPATTAQLGTLHTTACFTRRETSSSSRGLERENSPKANLFHSPLAPAVLQLSLASTTRKREREREILFLFFSEWGEVPLVCCPFVADVRDALRYDLHRPSSSAKTAPSLMCSSATDTVRGRRQPDTTMNASSFFNGCRLLFPFDSVFHLSSFRPPSISYKNLVLQISSSAITTGPTPTPPFQPFNH